MLPFMHDLISRDALARATSLSNKNPIVSLISNAARIPRINEIYRRSWSPDPNEFLDRVFGELEIHVSVSSKELNNIPQAGPFIIVANHPFGAIDGLALLKSVRDRRPDFRIMANFLLQYVQPLKDAFISVNPFEELRSSHSNVSGIKDCLNHLRSGGGLGIFPAGEVSTFDSAERAVVDKPWSTAAIKLIQKAGVPVIPVHFEGHNSVTFHALGMIHPRLRTLALPSELLKKSGSKLTLSIGRAIQAQELHELTKVEEAASYLRARTYAVGYRNAAVRPAIYSLYSKRSPASDIVPETDTDAIIEDIRRNVDRCIASHGSFQVFELQKSKAENVIREVGRLREITFRGVGEGTGNSIDLDHYDEYYKHLVLWDSHGKRIVGAYRIGHGPSITRSFGIEGLYLNSLYKVQGPAREVLARSAELGRSFVVEQYQRHRLSLFMLWKGIEAYLARHPEIQHLVGPVSISSNYQVSSKQMMIHFFLQKSKDHPLTKHVAPRTPYRENCSMPCFRDLLEGIQGSIKTLDRIVSDNEPNGAGLPVLIKKYMAQNGAILSFNCDADFNNSIDGFLIVDVESIPADMRQCLSQ